MLLVTWPCWEFELIRCFFFFCLFCLVVWRAVVQLQSAGIVSICTFPTRHCTHFVFLDEKSVHPAGCLTLLTDWTHRVLFLFFLVIVWRPALLFLFFLSGVSLSQQRLQLFLPLTCLHFAFFISGVLPLTVISENWTIEQSCKLLSWYVKMRSHAKKKRTWHLKGKNNMQAYKCCCFFLNESETLLTKCKLTDFFLNNLQFTRMKWVTICFWVNCLRLIKCLSDKVKNKDTSHISRSCCKCMTSLVYSCSECASRQMKATLLQHCFLQSAVLKNLSAYSRLTTSG